MSYRAELDAAWAAHLEPKGPDAPTVVSTFAGCGGSSLGYSMAGYREALAVEWDDHAASTFRANFAGVPLYHGDIAALSVEEALHRSGLAVGDLDVFDGSPPCQGFSTSGRRVFDDPRNQLFREYVRLLRGLQPRAFVMENVSGMVKGKMRLIFAEILRELKGCGYRVSARLLGALYFGVPQMRERMIFVGVREDLGVEPSHPAPERAPRTLRHALSGLELRPEWHRPLSDRVAAACRVARPGTSGGNRTSGMGRALYRTSGRDASGISLMWCSWDRPAFTLVHKEIADSGFIHPDGGRFLHPQEHARIQSFPDQFVFEGTRKEVIARIGNSVPPLLMRAVAGHLRT